jgi:hypothetical protein
LNSLLAIDGRHDGWKDLLPCLRVGVRDLVPPRGPLSGLPRPLGDYDVVAVGCPGRENTPEVLAGIQAYLAGGGFVVTTDRCLRWLLVGVEGAWLPEGRIRAVGAAFSSTELMDDEPKWVPVTRASVGGAGGDARHPLLDGLPARFRWEVPDGVDLVEVLDPEAIQVLLRAPDLGAADAVLFVTPVGRGTLVHFLAHPFSESSDPQGLLAAATILANLLDLAAGGAEAAKACLSRPWFRLASPNDELVTLKATGDPNDRILDREKAKRLMPDTADGDGNPLYKYFNTDGVPLLDFRFDPASGWSVRVPEGNRNSMELGGNRLDADWRPIRIGDQLTLFHQAQALALPELTLTIQ